jgi:hypothetical protein
MAMTREQDVFFAIAPALDWALSVRRTEDGGPRSDPRRRAAGAIAAAVAFSVVYAPQLAAYKILNGHLGPHASVANKMKWYAPHGLQVLFSPEHGYFVWTPLALVALLGLALVAIAPEGGSPKREPVDTAFRRNLAFSRNLALPLLVMFALQVYVGGSVESWTTAGGFGQRRFVALTTVLVIAISVLLARTRRRALWIVVVALCVYWNIAVTAEFAIGLMDRQRLEPAKNAYDAVVTLPRQAPALAYRYLFDRQSFYRAHPVSR